MTFVLYNEGVSELNRYQFLQKKNRYQFIIIFAQFESIGQHFLPGTQPQQITSRL